MKESRDESQGIHTTVLRVDLGLYVHNVDDNLMMREREREIDQKKFVDEEGDIDDESDDEFDGKDQLDLDLDSERNDDDLESDLLSDSEDRAGSAEDF